MAKIKNKKFIIKLWLKISFIFIIVILAIIAINFANKQINKINLTIQEKKEMNYLIKNRGEINTRIQKDFMSVDPDYEKKIKSSLPSVYNILPFVDTMDALAKKNSLEQTVNFGQPTPQSTAAGPIKISAINFTASLNNVTADNFINYLDDFEKLPYFASIETVSLNSTGANGWLDFSSVTLSGKLYASE